MQTQQMVANELESIKRTLDSIPEGLMARERIKNPTLVTCLEAVDRLVALLQTGAPKHNLAPYKPVKRPQVDENGAPVLDPKTKTQAIETVDAPRPVRHWTQAATELAAATVTPAAPPAEEKAA